MIDFDIQLRAATVQAEPVWFNADATIEKMIGLISEAAANDAHIIAFPEIFVPGYPWQLWQADQMSSLAFAKDYLTNGMELGDARMQRLMRAAKDHAIHVVVGYVEIWGTSAYMSQLFLDDEGNIVGNRRKLKPTHVERALFGDGNGSDLQVWSSKVGRVGALNCWEHFQPLERFTLAAMREQIHVASWPSLSHDRGAGIYLGRSPEGNEASTRMYALETGTFTLCSTQILTEEALDRFAGDDAERRELLGTGGGFARIFHPGGDSMTEHLPDDAEGILYADIDLNDILVAKSFIDIVGQYSRPDIFTLRVNTSENPWIAVDGRDGATGGAQVDGVLGPEGVLRRYDAVVDAEAIELAGA